jgi:hypothetical protein
MMINTKATIPIKLLPLYGCLALVMATFGLINVFASITPYAVHDLEIEKSYNISNVLPLNERRALQALLLPQQEAVLARLPSEPFAWARLTSLRLTVLGDPKSAFQALRMSDMVSPNEPRQKMERALMWHQFRAVESTDELAYQKRLWQKAVDMPNDGTWVDLKERGEVDEAADILKYEDSALYKKLLAHP